MSRLRENLNRRSVLKAGALVVAFSLAGAKVVSARVLVRDGANGDAPTAKAIGGFVRIEAAGRTVDARWPASSTKTVSGASRDVKSKELQNADLQSGPLRY